jgi:arsenate reductase-like glutaredoxin family protein
MAVNQQLSVQIFGLKNSPATRAAERFFKERRVTIHMVDLKQKPMAPGEIKRFIERFGLMGLLDSDGKACLDAGLKYLQALRRRTASADRTRPEPAPLTPGAWRQTAERRSA